MSVAGVSDAARGTLTLTLFSPDLISIVCVTGSNFVPGTVIRWNGFSRKTTFVDATHVTAQITADDVAGAGERKGEQAGARVQVEHARFCGDVGADQLDEDLRRPHVGLKERGRRHQERDPRHLVSQAVGA